MERMDGSCSQQGDMKETHPTFIFNPHRQGANRTNKYIRIFVMKGAG